jgi:hypothetical protein
MFLPMDESIIRSIKLDILFHPLVNNGEVYKLLKRRRAHGLRGVTKDKNRASFDENALSCFASLDAMVGSW